MASPERDDVDRVGVSDEAAVPRSPLEVSVESVADRVESVPEFSFPPEIDVHRNISGVHLSEVCERSRCLLPVSLSEHDEEIDVASAGLRALKHASKENASCEPVLAGEPGSVGLCERQERVDMGDVSTANFLWHEYFGHGGVSLEIWWGIFDGRNAFVG